MRLKIMIAVGVLALANGCVKPAPAVDGVAGVNATAPGHGDVQPHHDNNPRPFDASRDAMQDVDVALAAAQISGKRVLLVLGGNWCHDSRGLAEKFQQSELANLIEARYELAWIDVGRRDRNLDVAARFGVFELFGTPTLLIISPGGVLLNADSVHDWRTADSKPYDETLDYFITYAGI